MAGGAQAAPASPSPDTHRVCIYCDRVIAASSTPQPCAGCRQALVMIAATPDWLLIKLVGVDRLARMVTDRLTAEVARRKMATPQSVNSRDHKSYGDYGE